MQADGGRIDVHQHLWPVALVDELRRRTSAPMLRGWTLHTAGEAPYEVDPADHDPSARAALDAGSALVLVSLSAPLGIETLAPDEAYPLLRAWHEGVRELPAPFGAWASVCAAEPDLVLLSELLRWCHGLQLPAAEFATPQAVERLAPVLAVCADAGRPVLVHPGPAAVVGSDVPAWWPAVVDYPDQLQRAWWSWHVAGRSIAPALRVCFAAGAGLAPLQHERFTARGGGAFEADPAVFVDTSGHGPQAVDALTRALGTAAVVLGSDRPYAQPLDDPSGPAVLDAATRQAVCVVNPHRLLNGATG